MPGDANKSAAKDTGPYFLNVLKPKGITSFDVIFKLRRHLGIKKIGHSGTLDPLASGVMQVAVNNATKLIEYLPSDKKYIATLKFGYSSTTCDAEGEISKAQEPNFSNQELDCAVNSFIGKISQVPPIFSAIKVNGQKLCDIARKNPNAEVEILPRDVEIFDIKILERALCDELKIEVHCSKGTYIRSLAVDIAKKLGTCAYLTDLVRTQAGDFKIEDSIEIENVNLLKNGVNPADTLPFSVYILNDNEFTKVKNGNSIQADNVENGTYMLIFDNKLVSIANVSDNKFKCQKVFN